MELGAQIVLLLGIAAVVAGLATRYGLSAPLILTALGLGLSYLPGIPDVPLEPDLVLTGVLPPLLYATAIRIPWVDIRRNRRAIALLSVGLVIATALAVAVVVQLVLPGVPFAVALALGAVVAPPDAVAATAVARRVRMPRKVVALLEGESLLNDATALVTLRTALIAATATQAVSAVTVGRDFLVAVGAGIAVGWAVTYAVSFVRRLVDDPITDVTISLLVPYAAYLGAESLHGSGVIAVVLAGLMIGHRSTERQTAASRVTERVIWRTVQFVLESAVFLLIGLQLQGLVSEAVQDEATPNGVVAVLCLAVLATVIVVRGLWLLPATYLPRLVPAVARSEAMPPLRNVALVAWAGMRGVVTLAAALTIPEDVDSRPALVVAAFTVVIGTLLVQGTTLPWLVQRLHVAGPDPAQDALQEALMQQRAAHAGLERLEKESTDADPADVVASLQSWGERVSNAAWERLGSITAERETPAAAFYRLRVAMLESERHVVADIRRSGSVPHDLAERVLERVDQEEAMLGGFSAGSAPTADPEATALTPPVVAACQHLRDRPGIVHPQSAPDACPDCLAINERTWVHLRMCLDCGHVGCCDSSPNRHAEAHFRQTQHPVMRSIELGEAWRWCYVDSELG